MSRFSHVQAAPPGGIFALMKAYKEDPFSQKVDLGVGAYRDENAKPWVLPVVREVEQQMAADLSLDHEYLGQLGLESFTKAVTSMLLGAEHPAILEKRAVGVQCLSGTGSLTVGAKFLATAGYTTYYVSAPAWPNHNAVFKFAGFTQACQYRYWDAKTRGLDFSGMMEDLKNAPSNSVIVLHACAHNPTGVDLTQDQWKEVACVIKERQLFPFFDCAYQGFASGDLVRDSWAVRYFAEQGFELFCAQSFAKNFGLYNQRCGNLMIIMNDPTALANALSQMAVFIRGTYSNPPNHGARIVSRVLNTPSLYEKWNGHIKLMSGRIIKMRAALKQRLIELGTPGNWDHITNQIGMFCYTGFNQEQVAYLIQQHHIYLTSDGRISICGMNDNNVEYVAKAFHDTVTKFPAKL